MTKGLLNGTMAVDTPKARRDTKNAGKLEAANGARPSTPRVRKIALDAEAKGNGNDGSSNPTARVESRPKQVVQRVQAKARTSTKASRSTKALTQAAVKRLRGEDNPLNRPIGELDEEYRKTGATVAYTWRALDETQPAENPRTSYRNGYDRGYRNGLSKGRVDAEHEFETQRKAEARADAEYSPRKALVGWAFAIFMTGIVVGLAGARL